MDVIQLEIIAHISFIARVQHLVARTRAFNFYVYTPNETHYKKVKEKTETNDGKVPNR